MKEKFLFYSKIFLILLCIACSNHKNEIVAEKTQSINTEVCIYGATPSGILAAIAVKEEGRSVIIVEPSKWVGGILGAGLKPIQDCPNFEAVGGNTREIMKVLGIKNSDQEVTEKVLREAMVDTSPLDLREGFLKLLKEHEIQIIYDHRIQRTEKVDKKIAKAFFDFAPFDDFGRPTPKSITSENLEVKAKIFIDASYEGELMARSGVSFYSGRESTIDYQEEFGGVQEPTNLTPIDPYVVPGKKESGLLPLIDQDHNRPVGSSDNYTQAYNFRYYVTSDPVHRVEFSVPKNYSSKDFELVGRYVEYLNHNTKDKDDLNKALIGIFPGWLNSGEYNYQRNSLITMAPVGVSQLYINGDYSTKAEVWKYHQDYLSGLHQFLSTDSRVPEEFRNKTKNLGLDRRHHPETQGWPHQLYLRVSRRLVGGYTIKADDVYNRTAILDPIGLAQYGIDTYPSRRIVVEKDGQTYVGLEGKMFIGGSKGPTNIPYPISYRSIRPQKQECTNLLVPVCFSASHLGYASARMEPVFMICGESAGVAAAQAIKENRSVQDIDMKIYMNRLIEKGQRLKWPIDSKSIL